MCNCGISLLFTKFLFLFILILGTEYFKCFIYVLTEHLDLLSP